MDLPCLTSLMAYLVSADVLAPIYSPLESLGEMPYPCQMFEIIEPKNSRQILPDTIDMLTLLYRQGRTLEEIGRFIGVSRERVRQLIDTSVGGKRLQAANRRTRLAAINIKKHRRQELKFEAIFGCPYEEITRINGAYWNYGSSKSRGSDRATAFFDQRRFAETRGIEWKLSFPEWWRIWDDSGHWSERGRGKHRYCMSRPGDTGPYGGRQCRNYNEPAELLR